MRAVDTCRVPVSEVSPGALPELLAAGVSDGAYITLPRADYERIFRRIRGLGDMVEVFAKPIAKALKMDCLDEKAQLRPGSPCAKKRDWLNKAVPIN